VLQIQVANGSIKGGHAEDDLSDAFHLKMAGEVDPVSLIIIIVIIVLQ